MAKSMLYGGEFEFSRYDPTRKLFPAEMRHLMQKRRRSSQKFVLQSLARTQKPNKIFKKAIEHDILPPVPGYPCWADFYNIWFVGSYRGCDQWYRVSGGLRRGLGSWGGPKSGVSH